MHNISLWKSPLRTVCLTVLLVSLALMASCEQAADDDEANDEQQNAAPGIESLEEEACEEPITAEIAPAEEVSEKTGIYRYDFSLQETHVSVDLADQLGEPMGRVEVDTEADIDMNTGGLKEWRVITRDVQDTEGEDSDDEEAQEEDSDDEEAQEEDSDDEEAQEEDFDDEEAQEEQLEAPVEQVLRAREMGRGRLWIEVIDRAGDVELIQWTVVREGDEEPKMQMLAVEVEPGEDWEPETSDLVQMTDGRVFETLEIIGEGGERIGQNIIGDWVDEHIGDGLTSNSDWNRLRSVANDVELLLGADAHIRLCRAAGINIAEEELTQQVQAMCPEAKGDDLSQRQQASCHVEEAERWLNLALTIDDVVSALGFGAAMTTAAIGAGLVGATGGGAILVFAGSVAAYVVIDNMIESFVENNSETIMDGLFAGVSGIFEVVTGVESDHETAADFMTGRHDARSGGDPHFDTFDGLAFDFHGAGEFVLVESTAGAPFQIQTRQEPMEGNCPDVGINTAVAMRIGDARVAFYAGQQSTLRIDGEPANLPGGVLTFSGGGSIEKLSSNRYEVYWPTGEGLRMTSRWSSASDAYLLDLEVALPDHRKGQVQGLLGNFNGDPGDDIRPRAGEPFEHPVAWLDLTYEFGHSWRVDPDESLFDYLDGESYSTFKDETFPARPTEIAELPEDDRQHAETVCTEAGIENEAAYRGCVIDVACTGSDSLADSHTDRDPDEELEMVMPIFLDGWTQQGDLSNGTWNVSEDGRWVIQTVNGDPTFYVSEQDYHDVTIRGTFQVDTSSDDDFIGFVFGYQSPIDEEGHDEDIYDTFVLSWKGYDQEISGGHFGPEGFVLSHLDGQVTSSDYGELLWGHAETDVHRVLDTHFEHGRGWRHRTYYPFELTYTSEEIVIIIGGEEIFRLDAADSPVAFEPGRFGFYNYSQRDVVYGEFDAQSAEEQPAASLEGLEVGVRRPGSDFAEIEMNVGDPRICREACFDDPRCEAFTYRRPTFEGVSAYCWLKDDVPDEEQDPGFISGVR